MGRRSNLSELVMSFLWIRHGLVSPWSLSSPGRLGLSNHHRATFMVRFGSCHHATAHIDHHQSIRRPSACHRLDMACWRAKVGRSTSPRASLQVSKSACGVRVGRFLEILELSAQRSVLMVAETIAYTPKSVDSTRSRYWDPGIFGPTCPCFAAGTLGRPRPQSQGDMFSCFTQPVGIVGTMWRYGSCTVCLLSKQLC